MFIPFITFLFLTEADIISTTCKNDSAEIGHVLCISLFSLKYLEPYSLLLADVSIFVYSISIQFIKYGPKL